MKTELFAELRAGMEWAGGFFQFFSQTSFCCLLSIKSSFNPLAGGNKAKIKLIAERREKRLKKKASRQLTTLISFLLIAATFIQSPLYLSRVKLERRERVGFDAEKPTQQHSFFFSLVCWIIQKCNGARDE